MLPNRRSFLAGLAASSAVVPRVCAVTKSPKSLAAVENLIEKGLERGRAPGLAAALAIGGKTVWSKAFGWADRERRVRTVVGTPFSLASLTKPFTTTVAMTLVASGRMNLDEPISSLLDSSTQGFHEMAAGVTPRMLGAHLSGLPSMFEMFPWQGAAPPETAALLERWGSPAYPPMATYEYSNIGYVALAETCAHVAGMQFDELLRTKLIAPLGLRDTFYVGAPSDWMRAATRYDENGRPLPFYLTATPPSGELFSSVRDMIRFANLNLNTLDGLERGILPPSALNELHRSIQSGPHGGVAFGWFTGTTRTGLPVIFKDGGQPGVSTIMYLVPSARLACVVLTNGTDRSGWAQKVADAIVTAVIPDWSAPDTSMRAPSATIMDPSSMGRWAGEISGDGAQSPIELDFETGSLTLSGRTAEPLTEITLQGDFVVAKSSGQLASLEAARNDATNFKLRLFRREGRLEGRLLADAERPGRLAILPFIISLRPS